MRYVDHDYHSRLWPKVMGTYEREIAGPMTDLIRRARRTIVDVGAAEGYYAVGALFINPDVRVIAYEGDADAGRICRRIAERNGLADRLSVRGYCTEDELHAAASREAIDFLIMDVEGYEDSLLSPRVAAALEHTPVCVEIHDILKPGIGECIRRRFEGSHRLTEIRAESRAARHIDRLWLRWLLRCGGRARLEKMLWERPPGMSWFILTPVRV